MSLLPTGSLTISKTFFLPNFTGGRTYPLDVSAAFGYTVTGINGIQTLTGSGSTVTAAIQINGTSITGLSSMSVNDSAQSFSPTGTNNVVATGDALTVAFSSLSTSPSPQNIQFTLVATRAVATNGFVNKLRNPNFSVWQRGLSGSSGVSGNELYGPDGWLVSASGGSAAVTWTQAYQGIYSGNSSYALELTGNTGVTDTYVRQCIESDLAAQLLPENPVTPTIPITLQCRINNLTGAAITPGLTVRYMSGQDDWTSPVTEPYVSGVTLQSCSVGNWTVVAYTWIPSSANYGYGIDFCLDFGGALNSPTKYIYIMDADLRVTPGALPTGTTTGGLNSNPPTPEVRPVAIEFPFNQRYLAGFGETTGIVGVAYATSSTAFGVYIPFKNKMRVAPTGITVNTVGDLEIISMAGTNVAAVTGLSFGNASVDGIFLTGTVGSSVLTAGDAYQLNVATVSAGNVIFTGAEFL